MTKQINIKANINEIINTLNFPVKQELKSTSNKFKTSLKNLPYTDNVLLVTAFISWIHRMTNEETVSLDIHKDGQFYPLEITFSEETTVKTVVSMVQEALLKDGVEASTNHIIFTDKQIDDVEGNVFQLVVEGNSFYLAGTEQIINANFEQRYLSSFNILALDLNNNKEKAVLDLEILTPEEVDLWKSINDNKKDFPKGETLHGIFSKTARNYPKKYALSNESEKITFRELEKYSNQVANYLVTNGVKIGDYIAVYMERSIEAIVGMLGVMKAGAVYVPLSPDNPNERNAYIMQDANTKGVLTNRESMHLIDGVAPEDAQIMNIENIAGPATPVHVDVKATDIAYIIYTSGSTGKPKGVKIPHKSIITFGYSELEIYDITSEDTLTQFYTLTFDASLLELCPMIFTGACLYMLSKEERLDVSLFADAIKRENITSAMMLPMSALKQFSLYATDKDVEAFRNLKYFGVGGEALTGETARLFQNRFGNIPLINVYGPTECSVLSTTYTVTDKIPEDLVNIPIGKPLKNYSVYIVNEKDHLNPIGVPGELLIETEGLSEGYLNLPEKTSEVFVKTHLSDHLVYRSGDIVKLLDDGNIEFVGRKDSQVKIRGYRVEMGEIEDKLLQVDFIEDGAIVAADVNGDKILVAYYKQKDNEIGSPKAVLDFLTTKVPKYMIPSYIIELEDLPQLPSGKINRKELAARPIELKSSFDEDKKAPSNEVEEKFVEAWKSVLGLSSVGVDENFFEIGGHSLKVLATLSILKKDFPTLKINDFFTYPTIEALAQKIRHDQVVETEENVFTNLKETDLYEHPKRLHTNLDYKAVSQTGVLLTGVTGYLGSHILIDLVRDTNTTVYALVRAKSREEGLERLKSTLSYYAPQNFYINYNLKDRVVVIPGDFTKADLGLSKEDYAKVQEKVNSIIHCGADVRHFGSKEEFTKTNVDSTKNLLKLAEQLCNARFHYVSTLGIPEDLAMEGNWDRFLQATNIADAPEIMSLYTNSKLESEKLVEEYYKKGLPVTIYRPGNITCQYETGMFQMNINDNAVYRMLKGFILLGVAPDVDYKMDFTMVDFASKSITTIAMLDESIGGVYNICNPLNISYKEFIQSINDFGYDINLLPQQEYVDYLYSDQPKDKEGLELAMAGLEGDGAKDSPLVYTCPHTMSVLNKNGVKVPTPDKAFVFRMLEHAIHVGYFNRPAVLARV
ncbi:hypothetical protein B5V89_00730 [Heyndrickxia sporothermodurans]|uniref:non-ribosomal peptide synthetase n=1 Tax=Heyndrickxia sporothermodurans TaxID=46224 RepID=UPI000D36C75D|nr:non-ribosomal peptide synthetase [Heyndrickxia sporothermodurans]PTY80634.1 hypothetical protein B5V89_00730 [Heyndrickxia sporothermodurans]